mmetsp:Transcript_26456/g.73872  ORF Transcript_26456/g.73872 Transcript_26456/m.73872 type:complete len:453 (-) Transcript_26456:665-2023(-)
MHHPIPEARVESHRDEHCGVDGLVDLVVRGGLVWDCPPQGDDCLQGYENHSNKSTLHLPGQGLLEQLPEQVATEKKTQQELGTGQAQQRRLHESEPQVPVLRRPVGHVCGVLLAVRLYPLKLLFHPEVGQLFRDRPPSNEENHTHRSIEEHREADENPTSHADAHRCWGKAQAALLNGDKDVVLGSRATFIIMIPQYTHWLRAEAWATRFREAHSHGLQGCDDRMLAARAALVIMEEQHLDGLRTLEGASRHEPHGNRCAELDDLIDMLIVQGLPGTVTSYPLHLARRVAMRMAMRSLGARAYGFDIHEDGMLGPEVTFSVMEGEHLDRLRALVWTIAGRAIDHGCAKFQNLVNVLVVQRIPTSVTSDSLHLTRRMTVGVVLHCARVAAKSIPLNRVEDDVGAAEIALVVMVPEDANRLRALVRTDVHQPREHWDAEAYQLLNVLVVQIIPR